MTLLGYKTIGTGEQTLLILHELMGDHRNYDSILPYLSPKKFTYIFTDLRGYGLSKHIVGTYTCEEAANDVKNLISHLNIQKIHLIAHSMSTMIAQKIAIIDKEHIQSLVLVTPLPASGIKMTQKAQDVLLKKMQENKNKIEEIVVSASKRYNQAWIDARVKMAYDASKLEARVGYMKMYLTTDFSAEIQNLTQPINIIVRKHDFPVFSRSHVEKVFSTSYDNINIVECQEAGHYPMIECPIYFATKLEEFCS